jgi:hypothetical protein
MSKGEILEKSFICKCQQIRITVQMLPGRTVPVSCRLCRQRYEITEKNGQLLVEAEDVRVRDLNNGGLVLELLIG